MGDLGDSGGSPVCLLESGQEQEGSLEVMAPGMQGQVELQGEGDEESQCGKGYRGFMVVVGIVPAG